MGEILSNDSLKAPSWENVRPVYKKLSEEFHVLTDSFNLKVDSQTKNFLDHLILIIDEVDNCIDQLPNQAARESITSSLVGYLSNDQEEWDNINAPDSLALKITNLKYIVKVKSIQSQFSQAAKMIFYNTEIKRHTISKDELINYIILEGKATAVLPLSILGIDTEDKFGIFFSKLCTIMGIVDLIFDARQDYRDGIILVKPNFKLYFQLIGIAVNQGLKIIFSFPKKIKFIIYCGKFIRELMRE